MAALLTAAAEALFSDSASFACQLESVLPPFSAHV